MAQGLSYTLEMTCHVIEFILREKEKREKRN